MAVTEVEVIIYAAAALVVIVAAWVIKAEAREPPPEPASTPAPDRDIKAELSDLRKAIERIHENAARHDEDSEDAFRDVNKRMDRIERGVDRICDRMDAEARIGSALARMGKEG